MARYEVTSPAVKLSTPITGPRIVFAICPISRTGGVSQAAEGSRYKVGPLEFANATVAVGCGVVTAQGDPGGRRRLVILADLRRITVSGQRGRRRSGHQHRSAGGGRTAAQQQRRLVSEGVSSWAESDIRHLLFAWGAGGHRLHSIGRRGRSLGKMPRTALCLQSGVGGQALGTSLIGRCGTARRWEGTAPRLTDRHRFCS